MICLLVHAYVYIFIISSSSISIQPLGQFGQGPEPSQATRMALVRCVLGKFLGWFAIAFPHIYVCVVYMCIHKFLYMLRPAQHNYLLLH
jgi:hypothetical protein